jgi:dienelactone hydrolase
MAQVPVYTTPAWHARFRTPEIHTAQLAYRNPSRGLVAVKLKDKPQLYAWAVHERRLSPLTDLAGGTSLGTLLSDGSGAIYLHDEAGDEKGHYAFVDFERAASTDLTPDLPRYAQAGTCSARHCNSAVISMALQTGFDTALIPELQTGIVPQTRHLYHSLPASGWPELSSDGALAAVHTLEFTEGNRYSVRVLATSTSDPIGLLTDGKLNSIEFTSFSPIPGDSRLLAFSDRSGAIRPLIWEPVSGETRRLALPDLEGDVKPLDWSPDARKVVLMQISRARQSLHLYSLETDLLTSLAPLHGSLGFYGGMFGREAFFTPDGALFALLQDAQHPIRIVELDPSTGSLLREVLNLGDAPPGQPFESVTFSSSDGTPIQAWLSKPPTGSPPYPTIIHTHGGPEAAQTEEFLPDAQAWLDNGFAFLTVNYRGSTTFGKGFKEQIWGHPGSLEVEDLVAARSWCVAAKVADPKRVFLTGYSYGGYLTLLAMGKAPSLWAGGMALAAISDWRSSHELSNPALRAYCEAVFLGTPQDKPEAYAIASPISYASDYDAPLLIIQGANDSRTPAEPIRAFQEVLLHHGKRIEVKWYEAGHVGPSVDQWIEFQQEMMDFALNIIS